MDVRGPGQAQSRRSSLKRPWDEEEPVLPAISSAWNGAILPPIGTAPYRQPSIPLASSELAPKAYSGYTNGLQLAAPKRPKYEGNDTPIPPRTTFLDPFSSSFTPPRQGEWRTGDTRAGDEDAQNTQLCPRCRRLATPSADLDLESRHEMGSIKDPALVQFTELATAELTKAVRTLASGVSSARGGTSCRNHIKHQYQEEYLQNFPPIGQRGLKQSLDWLVSRLSVVNMLADKLVQHIQPPNPRHQDPTSPQNDTRPHDAPLHSMKRHLDVDPSDSYRHTGDGGDSSSDSKIFTRRRSVLANPSSEDLVSGKSSNEYHSPHPSLDGSSRRPSIMNPPPAPVRQLPSSPGRSLPSPSSMSFPSPSGTPYGGSSQSMAALQPGPQAPTGTHFLPPIGSAHYSDSAAIQAHSASLQHEVSVQKIALSSLQSEHDKLLAAFSRSQTRASALETKHAVSDNEIIVLSEDKARLQTQVAELEKDIEDLTRSRNEARQSAVQEGKQYVEIVKMASQLERISAEERKAWNTLKEQMGQRITLLAGRTELTDPSGLSPAAGMGQSDAPPSLTVDKPPPPDDVLLFEPTSPQETREVVPNSSASNRLQQDPVQDLQAEISNWKSRCEELEETLRALREESRSMEGIVQTLGSVGKSMLEKADRTLRD